MRYALAIFFPPLAVFLCGVRPIALILNFLLCFTIFGAMIHALLVVSSHKADKRAKKIVKSNEKIAKAIKETA